MTAPQFIVAAVAQDDAGRVLLLRRAADRTEFPGHWCFVTGFLEPGEGPEQAGLREVREELGVEAEIIRRGRPVIVDLPQGRRTIIPLLVRLRGSEICLEAEHDEARWVPLSEVANYRTVPQLLDDLRALDLLPG